MTDLVQAALEEQEHERATGFASFNPPLAALRELAPSDLLDLVHELRAGESPSRELAARLLSSPVLAASVVVEEVSRAAQAESDANVVRWLVSALQSTKDQGAMPQMAGFARHADARVRFGVPDGLSACAGHFREAGGLLDLLSKDPDRDVRWSAVFELAAWLSDPPERITAAQQLGVRSQLQELAVSETDPEIRALALSATSERPA